MDRGLLFTQGFLLVVFDLPPRFHCPVLPQSLLRTTGFCTAAFEPAAVSLTVPLTGSVVAVTQKCSDNVFVGRLQATAVPWPCGSSSVQLSVLPASLWTIAARLVLDVN